MLKWPVNPIACQKSRRYSLHTRDSINTHKIDITRQLKRWWPTTWCVFMNLVNARQFGGMVTRNVVVAMINITMIYTYMYVYNDTRTVMKLWDS
jgi:hypothetical protein